MKLQDFKVGKQYIVKDIRFCDDCSLDIVNDCTILGLMNRGLVPGSELVVEKKELGLYQLRIDTSKIVIREDEGWKFNIDVE